MNIDKHNPVHVHVYTSMLELYIRKVSVMAFNCYLTHVYRKHFKENL